MPAVSARQERAMMAAAHGHSTLGIPKSVGKEFVGDAADDDGPKAAGVVFVAPDGDVLLLRRSGTEENWAGHWGLPGGKAEAGETAEQAAVRECKEEMGSCPAGKRKLIDYRATPNGFHFSTFVQPVENKFVPTLDGEHTGFCWAGLNMLPAPLHPSVAEVLGTNLGVASDMTPQDWTELRDNFTKWTREEQKEGEHAEDAIAMDRDTVRRYDADGRLHVESTPISKANICEYWGREIPDAQNLGLDANTKYRLLRHPDELARGAATFNNIQVLRRHIPVSVDDHQADEVIGSTGTDAAFDAPYLRNSLVIWAKDDVEKIESGLKKELSSSYRYRADMTPGTYEGQPYDGVMRDIIGNHVAVVEEGRAGPDVVVGDSKENLQMTKIVLSSKGILIHGALMGHIAPLLAADTKIADVNIKPLLAGVTSENYAATRALIAHGVANALSGKLAKDAKLNLEPVLLACDAEEPEEKEKKADDEDDDDEPPKKPAKDKGAKDKAAADAMEDLKERMKKNLSAEDYAAACDAMEPDDGGAMDEDDEDEKKKKAAEDKARDEEMKKENKSAMDAAITGERDRNTRIRQAERFVHPWVGSLVAMDSAKDEFEIYKLAIESTGHKLAADVHPSAYKSILELLPKPGAVQAMRRTPRLAADSAASGSFASRYPEAASIRVSGAR